VYQSQLIKTHVVLGLLMIGAALLARLFGWRLPVHFALPVFLLASALLQPQPPGAARRSFSSRAAIGLLIGALAGGALWLIEVGTR
jgi:hypothetical protein